MPDIALTQSEADALIAIEKHREDETQYDFPLTGGSLIVPLISANKREKFLLDIGRGRINVKKITYQNRARTSVILLRLDIEGPPHENPDGQEMPCPHLHIYRENFGDRWAFPVPPQFTRLTDVWATLDEFMTYCNITQKPLIQRGLFI